MKESLTITFSEYGSTHTARSMGFKASSTNSAHAAAKRLVEKMYGYEPENFEVSRIGTGPWVATWTAPKKEAA